MIKASKNVTMREMASILGCSAMTVSKALRGSSDIPEATRERVLKAAKESGYMPNRWASAARSSKFNNIGYVFQMPFPLFKRTPNTSLSMEFISGVNEALVGKSIFMSIDRLEKAAGIEALPRILRERVSDGVIVEFEAKDDVRGYLDRLGIPIIYLNAGVQGPFNCVYADERHIGYEATMHLVRLGHRRIAFPFSFRPGERMEDMHFALRQKLAGYKAAMKESGLEPMPLPVASESGDVFAAKTVAAFKDGSPKFSAIASAGATPIYVEALRQGVKMPDELSIVSLEMAFSTTRVLFNLDRILMDRHAMGRHAAEMLLARIDGLEASCESYVDRPSLEQLGSSAPYRGQ